MSKARKKLALNVACSMYKKKRKKLVGIHVQCKTDTLYFDHSMKKSKPDGSSLVDLCHHLLPPTDISIISDFPQCVVLHNIAHSKGGAGATLVEWLTFL